LQVKIAPNIHFLDPVASYLGFKKVKRSEKGGATVVEGLNGK